MPVKQANIFEDPDKGYYCECCGSYCKRYKRTFNANMATALIHLYKSGQRDWVKMEDFIIQRGLKRCGDFSYLRFYGLIEKKTGNREDGSNRNGFYRLTGRGILFAENKSTVQEKFYLFNGKFEGFAGDEVGIKHCLGNKFNYEELIANQ